MFKLEPKDRIVEQMLASYEDSNEIVFRHGHIAIRDYRLGDNKAFEKYISVYNKPYFRYEMIAGYYVREYHELRLPRGYPVETLQRFFPNRKYVVDNVAYPHSRVNFDLYVEPRDDLQRIVLSHTLCLHPYESMKKYTQQVVTMDPGDGKTYTMVATQSALRCKSIVFVPNKKLRTQWVESYLKFTSLKKNQVKIIDSGDLCEKVRKGQFPEVVVFILVINTFEAYVKSRGEVKAQQFLMATGAYMKVVDETHRNMGRVMQLDALSNFRMNYYLTASFGRSDKTEDMIFNKAFSGVPRIGEKLKAKEEKHTNILIKKYYWQPEREDVRRMVIPNVGLNIKTYEEVLMERGSVAFEKELKKMFNWMSENLADGAKILLITATINGINYLERLVKRHMPNKSVGIYHSKISEKEKQLNLLKDIVIATDKGLGEGADLDMLQYTLNITTYSSGKIASKQYSGRNRKQGFDVVYIEMVNFGWESTLRQFERREPYLKKCTKSGKLVVID